MEFRGRRDRGLKFIRPYRNIGELNPTEQLKLARHPFEVAQAVIDTYSKQGPASIAKVPGELERLKWVGMYPQRQGGDAFMMRIKVPGGVMTAPQVREIGVAADAFADGPDESPVFGNLTPTSPRVRTSSCTGYALRTCRASGSASGTSG